MSWADESRWKLQDTGVHRSPCLNQVLHLSLIFVQIHLKLVSIFGSNLDVWFSVIGGPGLPYRSYLLLSCRSQFCLVYVVLNNFSSGMFNSGINRLSDNIYQVCC